MSDEKKYGKVILAAAGPGDPEEPRDRPGGWTREHRAVRADGRTGERAGTAGAAALSPVGAATRRRRMDGQGRHARTRQRHRGRQPSGDGLGGALDSRRRRRNIPVENENYLTTPVQ